MSATSHTFPSLNLNMAEKNVNLTSDTLKVLLIASGGNAYTWNSTAEAVTNKASFLAGSGAGSVSEVTGTGYTAGGVTLSSVSVADSGLVTTFSCANPTWTGVTISIAYALFYDTTFDQCLCYWDFGGTQSFTAATFVLSISGSGLITWTAS
jgi:hypothetical protein